MREVAASCKLTLVGDNAASEVTVLLRQWKAGDRSALDNLTPLVHGELRRLAASYLRRERADHTLQPTAQ
jgi:RNA polymerase sigma-70 factor, ECF subfamily